MTLFDYDAARAATVTVPPPGIVPVVVIQGTDYAMGFQYGQQAAPYIELMKEASWVSVLESQSLDEVRAVLGERQEFIDRYTPEAVEQMEGMAAGATAAGFDVSYEDILVINCMPKKLPPRAHPEAAKQAAHELEEHCSVFAAWGQATTDGRMVFGDSKDSVFNHQVVIMAYPDQGNAYMTGCRAGELAEHFSMNNKGLFIGTGNNPSRRDIDLGHGLHKAFSMTHILRFADNAEHAKDMFVDWEYPNATNFIFADTRGGAFVVERTNAVHPVRTMGDFDERDFIYSTNTAMCAEMGQALPDSDFIDHAGWDVPDGSAIPRSLNVWNMLHHYHGKLDGDFATMMWRFSDHPDPHSLGSDDFVIGRDQKIGHRENIRIAVGQPDDGDDGMVHICTGPATPRVPRPTDRHRDCFQIGATHSFYTLRLAATPREVVAKARDDAHDAMAEANFELSKLSYSDAGYGVLHEIYDRAAGEYYDGVHAYHKGCLADGDDALLHMARGATALARAQAHAGQIADALVPPACRPDDLGHRPYGFWE